MPDPIFAHPRLAPIYDHFEGDRDDLVAYLAIAEELRANRVLDIGCGTGCLALLLAGTGRTVVAVDPAEASLAVAKSKDGAAAITWIHGDAATVPAIGADLAVMTGNVAQVFLTDDDWLRALNGIHAALRPGGYLVFETRRPERRAWEEWNSVDLIDRPGIGPVERRCEVFDVNPPFVSFRNSYRFLADETEIISNSTLRFRNRTELESALVTHGYQLLDLREAPDRPARELVFITQRTP